MHSKPDPPLDLGHIESRVRELERRMDELEQIDPLARWRPFVLQWTSEQSGRFAFNDLCGKLQVPPNPAVRRAIGELLRRSGWAAYRSRGRLFFKRG